MLAPRYIERIKDMIVAFDPNHENRYVVFGSSLREERFGDVDLGVVGNNASHKKLHTLREMFEESHLPYFVDVVDIDAASKTFAEYVFNNEKKYG
jgi:predicted nucleotidyltransferase